MALGGVTTLRAVSAGAGSAAGEASVACVLLRAEMVAARGLSGVAGSECVRYQENTVRWLGGLS